MTNAVTYNPRTEEITLTRGGKDYPLRHGTPGSYVWYWTDRGECRQIFARWGHGNALAHADAPRQTAGLLARHFRYRLQIV